MKSDKSIPTIDSTEGIRIDIYDADERLDRLIHPHRMSLGCFVILLEGSAKLTVNLLHVNTKKGDIITMLPGSIVQLTERSDDFRVQYILLSQGFITDETLLKSGYQYIETIQNNPVLEVEVKYMPLIIDYWAILSRIHKQIQEDKLDRDNSITSNMLLSFFYSIIAMYERRNPTNEEISHSRKDEIVRDLKKLIMSHYQKERSVAFYAEKLCITSQYLSEVCKGVTGKTVSNLISEAVMLDAKAQLKSSSQTIQQISDTLNFPNPSFFSKYFKQHTGMAPKEYRENGN